MIQDARILFEGSNFISSDIFDYMNNDTSSYDVVMSWSVIKSIRNWRDFLDGMIERANNYVLFDARFFDIEVNEPLFDVSLYKAEYGGEETPLMYSAYQPVLTHIANHSRVEEVQICAYRSKPDPHSTFGRDEMPDCYIFSFCIKIGSQDIGNQARIYKQLPVELRQNG